MYVILVYDVDEKRVNKVNKFLKRYLIWIQNSVFEGEINGSTLDLLLKGIKKIIDKEDSLIIYEFKSEKYIEKVKIGKTKGKNDNVI